MENANYRDMTLEESPNREQIADFILRVTSGVERHYAKRSKKMHQSAAVSRFEALMKSGLTCDIGFEVLRTLDLESVSVEVGYLSDFLPRDVVMYWMEGVIDLAEGHGGVLHNAKGAEQLTRKKADVVQSVRNKLMVASTNSVVRLGSTVSLTAETTPGSLVRLVKNVAHFLQGARLPSIDLFSSEVSVEYLACEQVEPIIYDSGDPGSLVPPTMGDLVGAYNMLQCMKVVQPGTRAYDGAPINYGQGGHWPYEIQSLSLR